MRPVARNELPSGVCQDSCHVILCGVQSLLGLVDDISRGIEPNLGDRIPIADLTTPTLGMACFGLLVERFALRQDVEVETLMSFMGGDELDGTVAVLVVVPAHELLNPLPGGLQTLKPLLRVGRTVFASAKERLEMCNTTFRGLCCLPVYVV